MIDQDHELAVKIVRRLNQGADHLDRATRERLLAARTVALSHYKDKPEPVWGLAAAGQVVARFTEHRALGMRYLIPAAALVLGLIGVVYWQVPGPANDSAEIDVGLLTDDLPINAYLDRGFDSWLKRSLR
jgi:uncharacterized protein DUF3619